MPVGTTTALLLGVGGAIAGKKAGLFGGVAKEAMNPIPLPQPPSQDMSQEKGLDLANKRRASMSQSIFTSPLGISGQADIAKKTLLGQ